MRHDGYVYIWDYLDNRYPFQIFIGGRGTGKTYGALDGATGGAIEDKFILMRRTAQELELMLDSKERGEGANPFKSINRDSDKNIGMRPIVKNMAGIYNREFDPESQTLKHIGAPIGYGVALSTIASIRGVDFAECSDIIYDEFIPEKHVKRIKEEGQALLNCYETINRNREFLGAAPCRLWLLANSNDIYNPIFIELGIVSIIEKMLRKGTNEKYIHDRGLAIHLINNNDKFVEKKANTALYKLTKGSTYYDMALSNKFSYNDFSLIGYKSIKGYKPIAGISSNDTIMFIYQKKGTNELYISYMRGQGIIYNIDKKNEKGAFIQQYTFMLKNNYLAGQITFESFEIKETILNLIY